MSDTLVLVFKGLESSQVVQKKVVRTFLHYSTGDVP